jgi:putative addiction module component (TIGR02574 family)
MRPDEIKSEIGKLSLAEKLLLIEDVWDSIAEKNADLPMPEWQKQELDKRFGEYMSGKQHLHDWRSVHEDIRNSNK